MKSRRVFLLILALMLVLSGCQGMYTYEIQLEGHTLTVNTDHCSIVDGEAVYQYEWVSPHMLESTVVIHYPDGVTYTKTFHNSIVITGGNGSYSSAGNPDAPEEEGKYIGNVDLSRYLPGELLAKAVSRGMGRREQTEKDQAEMGKYLLAAAILLIVGFVQLRFPEFLWHTKHWWSVEGGEPSDMYLDSCRFWGIVSVVAGAIFLLMGIF